MLQLHFTSKELERGNFESLFCILLSRAEEFLSKEGFRRPFNKQQFFAPSARSEACLTANPGVVSSNPSPDRPHNFRGH